MYIIIVIIDLGKLWEEIHPPGLSVVAVVVDCQLCTVPSVHLAESKPAAALVADDSVPCQIASCTQTERHQPAFRKVCALPKVYMVGCVYKVGV